jgi:hypothetical protein
MPTGGSATPQWTGDLATYRQMLINHEFGHLLGQRHPPAPQCPVAGEPALVMSQQSTELDGCYPTRGRCRRSSRAGSSARPPAGAAVGSRADWLTSMSTAAAGRVGRPTRWAKAVRERC